MPQSKYEIRKKQLKMLDFYYETELQFLELIRVIPLDNDLKTYSPRLYNIVQSSCGQVENMFRVLCDILELKYTRFTKFPVFYKKLNQNDVLKDQEFVELKTYQRYQPFRIPTKHKAPLWWEGYNNTKHDPDGLKQGNLENAINALGAVCILHSFANYAFHNGRTVFDSNSWGKGDIIIESDGVTPQILPNQKPISQLIYLRNRFDKGGTPLYHIPDDFLQ